MSLPKLLKLLRKLRTESTEQAHIECKENLLLDTAGDCARFVKHVAAFANTGRTCYMIVGIEDQTWNLIGLDEASPLVKADSTEQRMNQILANKIDPPISVTYRTYSVDNVTVGLVSVEGNNRPYIVAIETPQYGGPRTKGEGNYINQGAIYIRRGSHSIVANRHSQLVTLLEGRRDLLGVFTTLVFIAVIVGIGVGVGVSVIRFGDPWAAALLGATWGAVIGWILNKRLVDELGTLKLGALTSAAKATAGSIWGAATGGWLSYIITNAILEGKLISANTVTMAFVVGVYSIFWFIVAVVWPYALQTTFDWLRKYIRERSRNS
jgi:hypothetical protein